MPLAGTSATIPIVVTAEDGAVSTHQLSVTTALPQDGAKAKPASAVLSTTQGWSNGLPDGNYDVTMYMWWGTNASVFLLYQNDTLIATVPLHSSSPNAQSASVPVKGLANGDYVYRGVLLNQAGETDTGAITIHVTAANPGTPVLSSDNRNGSTSFTVSTNMWWGTNATKYRLYEDGVLIDTQALTAATPAAQHASTSLVGQAGGKHTFVAVRTNPQGSTSSQPLSVTVK